MEFDGTIGYLVTTWAWDQNRRHETESRWSAVGEEGTQIQAKSSTPSGTCPGVNPRARTRSLLKGLGTPRPVVGQTGYASMKPSPARFSGLFFVSPGILPRARAAA